MWVSKRLQRNSPLWSWSEISIRQTFDLYICNKCYQLQYKKKKRNCFGMHNYVMIRHIWQFLCSVEAGNFLLHRRSFLHLLHMFLLWSAERGGRGGGVIQTCTRGCYKISTWTFEQQVEMWTSTRQLEKPKVSCLLTFPSRCSCSVLTVSLSLVSCSWVALRSCWSLVAAWPRSLDNFFSFSRRSWNNRTSSLHTQQSTAR